MRRHQQDIIKSESGIHAIIIPRFAPNHKHHKRGGREGGIHAIIHRMIKPWYISPPVQNTDRLRNYLSVLTHLEGQKWNVATREAFQILLIQKVLFRYYLPPDELMPMMSKGIKEISPGRAKSLFVSKNYKDPSYRAVRLVAPLIKCGFLSVESGVVHVTGMGDLLLAETCDYSEIILRFLLKWELPNQLERNYFPSHGYNIKPFIGLVQLLGAVNQLCRNKQAKGMSYGEVGVFGLTLIDWRDIQKTAEEIMAFRRRAAKFPAEKRAAFLDKEATHLRPQFNMRNLRELAFDAVNYFRATKYLSYSRGEDDFYVNFEKTREVEINSILRRDNARPIFCNTVAQCAAVI